MRSQAWRSGSVNKVLALHELHPPDPTKKATRHGVPTHVLTAGDMPAEVKWSYLESLIPVRESPSNKAKGGDT